MVNIFIAIICGYLIGSIPSAYIAGRLRKGIDIRTVGSKNMGAMNVYYEVGLIPAVFVLLADVSKGIAAILIARYLLDVPLLFELLTGFAAVIGHTFPIFLKFRGGKGGATTFAILLFLMPKAIPFWFVTCLVALLTTHNFTFCYSIAFICFPLVAWLVYHSSPLVYFSIGLPIFVGINYIPRFKEMHTKTEGSWRKVINRGSLKERL
jgi:glycerol-3-phosphate acyltransferase PlsY